jgi:hypothetical protein
VGQVDTPPFGVGTLDCQKLKGRPKPGSDEWKRCDQACVDQSNREGTDQRCANGCGWFQDPTTGECALWAIGCTTCDEVVPEDPELPTVLGW